MNIKDYKDKEINMYILGIVFLYIYISNSFNINNDKIMYFNQLITTTLASGIIYLFTYLSDAIVSSYFKDKIIYLFGIINKPGECIFSTIREKGKDDRISKDDAIRIYKDIYENMPKEKSKRKKYENSNWYIIYSKYREEKMIQISNREYLMTRDFVFVTIALFIIYAILSILKFTIWNYKFAILLFLLTIINLISANIKAKRFAYNVIALDLAKTSK